MRRLGLVLIIVGAVATVGAMFLTRFDLARVPGFPRVPGYQSLNSWELFHGLDIAMAAASAAAAGLAVAALLSRHGVWARLAGIAGALLFGLTFAVVPDTIDDPDHRGQQARLRDGTLSQRAMRRRRRRGRCWIATRD
jgi:hypothetical protein